MVLMYAMLMRCCWWLVALVAMALVFVAYSAFVVGCCAVAMVYRHVASWVRWAFAMPIGIVWRDLLLLTSSPRVA